jgi:hypothetical protein
VPVITEDQYTILKYIGKDGKTVEQICDYQPLGFLWDSKTFMSVLHDLQWSNLTNEKDRFITRNKFGEAAMKKYRWRKFRKDLEEFPRVYWPIVAIISYGIGLATPTIINKLKSNNQVQTKTAPIEQSEGTTKKYVDTASFN